MHLMVSVVMAAVVGMMLAAGAARAQAPAPGWVTDSRTGCRVWNNYPQANDGATWDGPCAAGVAQGRGKLQWYKGLEARTVYDGELRNGRREGRGATTFADGRYEGDYRNDRQEGQGTYRANDGWSYVGGFRNDRRNGRGVYTFQSGTVFDGDWLDGNRTGRGVIKFPDGASYDGQWLNNKPHGSGVYRGADGKTYSGQWNEGCFKEGSRQAWVGTNKAACGFQ